MVDKRAPRLTKAMIEADKLDEQEKVYCIQRAMDKSQVASLKLAYDLTGLDDKAISNKAYNFEKKGKIREEIARLKSSTIPAKHMAQQAKQLAVSEMWTAHEKNEQLLELFNKVKDKCLDDNGDPIPKVIECAIKILDASAKLSAQYVNHVSIKSESISYSFNLNDQHNNAPQIIEHAAIMQTMPE